MQTQTQMGKAVRVGLARAERLYPEQRPQQYWREMARVIDSQQAWEEASTFAGFPPAQTVPEGGTPEVVRFRQINTRIFPSRKLMVLYEVTNEGLKDVQRAYGIAENHGLALMASVDMAENIAAANSYMNLAFSSAADRLRMDGQPLASAAHPVEPGLVYNTAGTFSNIVPNNPPLGPDSLAAAISAMKRTPGHARDTMIPYAGTIELWVHPDFELYANELLISTMRPDTSNGAANVQKGRIARVVACEWFTNPTWWAVVAADPKYNRRVCFLRQDTTVSPLDYQIRNDAYVANVVKRSVHDVTDCRYMQFSAP